MTSYTSISGAQDAAAGAAARPHAHPGGSAALDDVAVTGSGDATRYHLYVAARGGGWRWRSLATIQPGGDEDQRWIGQECVTGDGNTAVVMVAPWSASNDAAGMDAGADRCTDDYSSASSPPGPTRYMRRP